MSSLRLIAGLLGLSLLWARGAQALEADTPLAQVLQRAWGMDEGLPQSSIIALAQTAQGHVYAGTQEGLVRFDGSDWEVFDTERGMPCTDVVTLHASADGTLWVGTSTCGLVRYAQGVFSPLPIRPERRNEGVQALAEGPDGTLWVGTDQGLARYRSGRLELIPELAREPIHALLAEPDGSVWVGLRQELARVVDGRVERFGPAEGFSVRKVRALARDAAGVLWVGTSGDGLWRRDGAGFTRASGLRSARIGALRSGAGGSLWVGTGDEGFFRHRAGAFEHAPMLLDASVRALMEDREGSLWVGTLGEGLHQLRQRRVEVLGKPEGLAHDIVWSLFEDRAGAVWIGSAGAGLHRLAGGQLTRFTPADGLPEGTVLDVYEDRAGVLWVATGAGLGRHQAGRFHTLTTKDGLPSNVVYTVLEDRAGDFWLGTDAGLARMRDGRFTTLTTRDGLVRDAINVIREAPEGGLWLGTPAGLERVVDGRVVPFAARQALLGQDISALTYDADDPETLWVATDHGLARLRRGELGVVRARDGLFDENLLSLVDDGRGHLWMGCNKGIFRVKKAELAAFLDGRVKRVGSVAYGKADGLRNAECASTSNSSALRTRGGALWFATVGGAVRLDAAELGRARPPPPVVLRSVLSEQRPVRAEEGLDGDSPDVEFHYAALTYVSPEKVRFRYRLEGYEQDWVEAGTRRAAFYTNLPPGQYRFRVAAEGDGDEAPPVEATFAFERHPRLHESRPVRLAALLGLLGLGFAAYKLRVGRLRARERELALRVEVRTRELQDALETSAESERGMRLLIDRLPTAITVYQDGRVVYANTAALELMGYASLEELSGTSVMEHCAPDEVEVQRARFQVLAQQQTSTPVREAKVKRRDGTLRLAEVCGVSLVFGGKPAVVSVARDVSEARQMEARLRVSDRMASVGTLAAGVAHEINNPLAYVTGNLSFAVEELARLLTEARRSHRAEQVEPLRAVAEALEEARHGAGRVRDIVKDLKTFSRDDEAESVPLDLRPVLESSLSMCNNEIKHRARLRKEWGAVPRVLATEAKLGQVFLNLLVNAAQALKDGAADQHEIVVRTFTDARGRAVVEVRDSGCGIPPENLKRIFDPFFTTKPVGVGTGLGLSICHNIVTALGGTICVESELEQGSCFRVVLPPAPVQAEAAAPVRPSAGAAPVAGARILVLDDDVLLSKSLVRLLGREARTEALANPREALARVEAGERFDVILCDVMMPEMSGQEFWEALGRVAPEQRERLVFVTGGAFTAEAQSFLQQVPNPVCPKPFDLEVLHAFVRERVSRARR